MEPSRRIKRLFINQAQRDLIQRVAEQHPALEVAGVLAGYYRNGIAYVEEVIFGDHKDWGTSRFRIDRSLLQDRHSAARDGEYPSLAIFHRHVRGILFPSVLDLKGMIITDLPWVILRVSNSGIVLRGFVFEEGLIRRVPISRRG